MTERFADWSPASVFGATETKPFQREAFLSEYNHSKSERLQQRIGNSEARYEVGEESSNERFGHSMSPSNRSVRRNSGRTIASRESRNSVRVPAASKDEETRNFAVRAIQRQVRVSILRRREQEAMRQVEALRLVLKKAAVDVLAQSFRRYRSRLAIDRYLRSWREQETEVQRMLQQVATEKQARASRLAAERRQQLQAQLHARRETSGRFICEWYAGRSLIRVHRVEEKQKAKRVAAQNRIACWYRGSKLEQRSRARLRDTQRHTAAVRIHRFYRRTKCEREGLHNRKKREGLERQSGLRIVRFYQQAKQMRRARLEVERRLRLRSSAKRLSALVCTQELKSAFFGWLSRCTALRLQDQSRKDASAKILQRMFRDFVTTAKHLRRRESAIRIQKTFKGCRARAYCHELRRRSRKEARRQLERNAAVRIQTHVRGFQARCTFATLMKRLRDRFRCGNCGVIEPCGVYCKLCGRKRTNSELRLRDSNGMHSILSKTSKKKLSIPPQSKTAAEDIVPMRPAIPPPFSKLQTSRNGKRRGISLPESEARSPKSNNNQQQERQRHAQIQTASPREIPAFTSLPLVLSPRHKRTPSHARKLSAPSVETPRPSRAATQRASSNQLEVAPIRPNSDRTPIVSHTTKLRAQALTTLQAQREESSRSHALAQHLHRLQKADHALSRSR